MQPHDRVEAGAAGRRDDPLKHRTSCAFSVITRAGQVNFAVHMLDVVVRANGLKGQPNQPFERREREMLDDIIIPTELAPEHSRQNALHKRGLVRRGESIHPVDQCRRGRDRIKVKVTAL